MNMIKYLLSLAVFSLIVVSSSFGTDFTQERVRVNTYYRELIQTQLDTMVPKGNYTVEVATVLDDRRLDSYFNDKEVDVKLPMSGMFGQNNYVATRPSAAGLSIEDMLKFVTKKSVRIGLTGTISPVVKDLIKADVIKQMGFSEKDAGAVEIFELPQEFSDMWTQWIKIGQATQALPGVEQKTNFWPMVGAIALFGAFMAFMLWFGLRSLSERLISQIKAISQQWSDQKGGSDFSPVEMKKNADQLGSRSQEDLTSESRIYEKLDLQALKLICADSVTSPAHRFIPYGLIFNWLNPVMSEKLDDVLEVSEKPFPGVSDSVPNKGDVTQFLMTNYSLFQKLSRNELALRLALYPIDAVVNFLKTLNSEESVVFVENLTPLKKQACIAQLSVQKRLEWAKVSLTSLAGKKVTAMEASLIAKLPAIQFETKLGAAALKNAFTQSQKDMWITPLSFVEDEAFFEATRGEPELYRGFLNLLDSADAEFWNKVDLKVLSLVCFGYSEGVQKQFVEKIGGKRAEWFQGFVQKQAKSGVAFSDGVVESMRKELLNQVSIKENQEWNEDQKAA